MRLTALTAAICAGLLGLSALPYAAAETYENPLEGLIKPGMTTEEINKVLTDTFPGTDLNNELSNAIKPGMTPEEINQVLRETLKSSGTPENPLEGKIQPGMTQDEINQMLNEEFPPLEGDNKIGCEGLLCLANPNGWKSVPECHPPVKEIFRRHRKHKRIPRCPQANEKMNHIDFVFNPYDPCSEMDLNDVTGYVASSSARRKWQYSEQYAGHGTSYCVGNYVGSYRTCIEEDSEGYCATYATIKVYDQLKKNPAYDPYSIDVTIEGVWRYRVHDN